MRLSIATRELHPRKAFRIARARRTAVENVYVRLESDGVIGYGEASPNAFYSETAEGVVKSISDLRDVICGLRIESREDVERAWEVLWPRLQPSRAAQCAVDLALWDLLARKKDCTVSELAWGEAPTAVRSFCTIGISTPEELPEKVDELAGFPLIKIKSDATADLTAVRFVRERRPDALIAVDANCAWGNVDLAAIAQELAALNVTFIEQPLPPTSDGVLAETSLGLPVMADESCVTEQDVDRAASLYAGFNIKLVKCGGLTPALRMVKRGRELGAKVMVGCMLESSALIAAGAVIGQKADYADLDGAWLLGDDPFSGTSFVRGVLTPGAPGFGVIPTQDLFESPSEGR